MTKEVIRTIQEKKTKIWNCSLYLIWSGMTFLFSVRSVLHSAKSENLRFEQDEQSENYRNRTNALAILYIFIHIRKQELRHIFFGGGGVDK